MLLDETLSTVDQAKQLGRTWNACENRRSVLYKMLLADGPLAYGNEVDLDSRPKLAPILCPCGDPDGDHEDWCPEAG